MDADGDDVGTSHHIVVREVANDLSMPGGSGSAIFSLKNKILCFLRVVLKEVLLIECCIEKERLSLKEQLKKLKVLCKRRLVLVKRFSHPISMS